jgi:dimethylaniline monooxygenase (N-oxide forming)
MRKICIIGAGISGLATAKSFLSKGFKVVVYEKGSSLGGVWAKERSYPGVTTQTTRDAYSFSDFAMPDHYPDWPSGEQVYQYLLSYGNKFGVTPCIELKTEVLNILRKGAYWEVELKQEQGKTTELFDYVVICSGTFHKAFIPQFAGKELFIGNGGKIIHTSQLNDISLLKHRDIVVVGFAKSATDVSVLAAEHSKSSTIIYRKAQWKVPRYFGNKVNMKYLLFSRFSENFFNYHKKSTYEKVLHSIGKPLVWAQWRGLESLLKWQYNLKAVGMVPKHRIEDQISCSLGVEPEGFYQKIKDGEIKAINSEIENYTANGLLLKNGQEVKADLIVFGTGFTQSLHFLEEQYRNYIIDEKGTYRLYHNIIHPDVPNLAFVGFNSSLFTTLTSEIASQWVVKYAMGEIKKKSKEEMLKSIDEDIEWRRKVRPIATEFSGTCIAPFNYHHLDALMRDMNKKTRASSNILYEFMKPINPKDYNKLLN